MLNKFLASVLIAGSSLGFASDFTSKGQVNLIGPTEVPIPAGWSVWQTNFKQPIQVNPLQILFWRNGKCNLIPLTNVSVKYTNDVYWYNTTFKDGAFYVDTKYKIEGVKLDFFLDAANAPEACVITVSGLRDIAE